MNEEDLLARFDALRAEDARNAPRFEALLDRRRRPRWSWTLVPILAVIGALALWVFAPGGSPPRDRVLVRVGLREPEPLAFLLAPVSVPQEIP